MRLMIFCRVQTCLSWLCEGHPWSSAPAGKCPCALLSSQQFCFPVPVNTLGCQAQCQLQQGAGSPAAFCLQPGDPGIWQESQAVLLMAKPAKKGRPYSLTPRSRALPSFVAVLASLASAEAIHLPKMPERFPPTPLAGVAFCRFSELCHPMKGSSHPQSWLGESLVGSPAGGDELVPAPGKAFFRHPRKLTKKPNLFLSFSEKKFSV